MTHLSLHTEQYTMWGWNKKAEYYLVWAQLAPLQYFTTLCVPRNDPQSTASINVGLIINFTQ